MATSSWKKKQHKKYVYVNNLVHSTLTRSHWPSSQTNCGGAIIVKLERPVLP